MFALELLANVREGIEAWGSCVWWSAGSDVSVCPQLQAAKPDGKSTSQESGFRRV